MDFQEVDEALYRHEAPYYRSVATGGFFEATPEWKAERARLTEQWLRFCPYRPTRDIPPPPPPPLIFVVALCPVLALIVFAIDKAFF